MLYLNEKDILQLGVDWQQTVAVIREVVFLLEKKDYAQPLKPYLRYKDEKNRIIAMPAYVGGRIDVAGLKWISSFPDNMKQGLARADSVIILNEADTGRVSTCIHTPRISMIRTASVSGLMLQLFLEHRQLANLRLGIIGWGPIGQSHYDMFAQLLGDRLEQAYIYDIHQDNLQGISSQYRDKITVASSWQEAYCQADICLTATASANRYINLPPKKGSLLLNVSLRDYTTEVFPDIDAVIVDDWQEVCRENTDIQLFSQKKGLVKEDTLSLVDVLCYQALAAYDKSATIMFNPMGMSVFDIAIASYYEQLAKQKGVGQTLQ